MLTPNDIRPREHRNYGAAPYDMGAVDVPLTEMCFYLYLPIKMPDHAAIFEGVIPERLRALLPLLKMLPPEELVGRYVYLTCKRTHVEPGAMSNRPGWHCDGFMTDDINYLWFDRAPTEFAVQDFALTMDDRVSMEEMAFQAEKKHTVAGPCGHLIRIDDRVVHRVSESHQYSGLRTFIKVSISRHRYNLEGNSHNYLIDYDWKMYSRAELRNMESDNNGDFIEEVA